MTENKVELNIKPLSVNDAYRGRRFASAELSQYKSDLALLLPKREIEWERLAVSYQFGVSSTLSDVDNYVKAFQDIMSECYGFNDRAIYKLEIEKIIVPKGQEFIVFDIKEYSG